MVHGVPAYKRRIFEHRQPLESTRKRKLLALLLSGNAFFELLAPMWMHSLLHQQQKRRRENLEYLHSVGWASALGGPVELV